MKIAALSLLCAIGVTTLPIFGSEGRATLETARADIDPAMATMQPVAPVALADALAHTAAIDLAR
jgi:hypothetical protein